MTASSPTILSSAPVVKGNGGFALYGSLTILALILKFG
jgi:hypothetical protein